MKNIYRIAVFFSLLLSFNRVNAQAPMGCLTPSLGVFDYPSFAPMSAVISCTYANLINISPTQFAVGNNGTSPCMRIMINPTNANAASNNSLAIGQGTNTNIYDMCASGCNSVMPSSTNYTFSLFFLDPSQSHGYNLCHTNPAGTNMGYTVTSCYSSAVLATGTWINTTAGGCQTVTIPAGAAIGQVGYTVSPAVVSTASFNANTGDLFLDTYQMAQGIYTISYSFSNQAVPSCSVLVTRTISITNPYVANWTAAGPLCANGACVSPGTLNGGTTAGGTFTAAAGMSGANFCPTIVGAGTFPVTYTVGITPTCGSSQNQNITVNPLPVANAGPTKSLTCVAITTVLAGSGGGTYAWSGPGIVSGGTTAGPTVGTAGTYTLTVTSGGCTSLPATVVVGTNTTPPAPTAGTSASVTCTNSVINLTSSLAGMNYTWTAPAGSSITGGVNNQNTTGSGPGTYTVKVVDPANGCSAIATIAAQINTVAPSTSAGTTGSVTCNNNSINLTSTTGGMTYTWTAPGGSSITGGANNQNTTGSGPGTYTVKIQSAVNGCTAQATVSAVINTVVPTVTAGTSSSVTCSSTAINLTSGLNGMTYTWTAPAGSSITGGVNNQNTTASGPGTYTVKATDAVNGCTNIATVTAVINTVAPVGVSANATSSITCTSQTLALSGAPGSGGTYTWVAPAGSSITGGVNNGTTTANGVGTYTLIFQSSVNGCTAQATAAAPFNTVSPVGVTASATSSITCTSQSLALNGAPGSGGTYTWVAPAGSSITGGVNSQNATASGVGTYTLIFQSATNGCTAQATASAPFNTVAPVGVTANATSSITCTSQSLSLAGGPSSGGTYTWVAPAGSSITGGVNSQNTTGSGPGTYTVIFQSATNGCTAQATASAPFNTVAPVGVSASATSSITCASQTFSLSGAPGSGGTYTWVAPSGSSITGGVNNGNTTGSGPGTYTVIFQSAANGCTAQATASAPFNTVAPTGISANTSGTVTCSSTAINLGVTPTGLTYSWTAPAGSSITSGATSSSATGNGGGTYSVVVTGTNGCSAPAAVVVANTNTTAPVPTINTPPVLTCATTTVMLTGNPSSGVLYNWSGPGIISSTNQSTVNVISVGTYSLIVTSSANSCTNIVTASVANNTIAPTVNAGSNQTVTCANPSVTLIGTANPSSCTVVWSGPSVCGGGTSYSATVCGTGTYVLTATNPVNGCSATSSVQVGSNGALPSATTVDNGTITCVNTSVQIVATTTTSPATYSWTGPGITSGASTATVNVNTGGSYSVVITGTNGCPGTFIHNVTNDNAPVTPTTSSSNTITCSSITATLTAGAGAGSFTYNWSGPGIVGTSTLSTATASLGGTYNVTVTNTSNGCVGTTALTVGSSTNAPSAVGINPSTFTLSCATPTTALTATAVGASSYSWIAPGTGAIISGGTSATAGINGPGNYSVVVTGTNGCSAAAAIATISPNNLAPTFTLSNTTPSITCLSSNPTVSVGITSTVGIGSYSWTPASGISGSSTGSVVTFTTAGTFTGVITATNGCQSNAIVTVANATTAPTFVAGTGTASPLSCANPTTIINPAYTPTTDITFSWSGPGIVGSATNSSVTVNQNGTYSVTVTNTLTGCASNSLTVVVVGTTIPPVLNVTSSSSVGLGCLPTNSTNILTANATPTNVTYVWSTSATTPTISVNTAGIYTVTITDPVTSCSTISTYTVTNNSTAPTATSIASAVMPCGASTATLSGGSPDPGVTFSWTGPSIISGSNTSTPVVDQPGIYILTVTNPTTGCTSTATVTLINGVPTASIVPDVTTGFAPQTVNFGNLSSPSATVFTWSYGDGNTAITTSTVSVSNTYSLAGTYTVTMIASTGLCSDTATAIIIIEDGFTIEIPNVFTPNGDNTNDVFTIKSTGVKEIELQIFNRWGQLMYNFTGAKAAWDGITNNGEKATDGTYFYFIIAKGYDSTKEAIKKNGSLGLFR